MKTIIIVNENYTNCTFIQYYGCNKKLQIMGGYIKTDVIKLLKIKIRGITWTNVI